MSSYRKLIYSTVGWIWSSILERVFCFNCFKNLYEELPLCWMFQYVRFYIISFYPHVEQHPLALIDTQDSLIVGHDNVFLTWALFPTSFIKLISGLSFHFLYLENSTNVFSPILPRYSANLMYNIILIWGEDLLSPNDNIENLVPLPCLANTK